MINSGTSHDNTKSPASGIGRNLAAFQLLLYSSVGRWAPLPLRLIVGYGFAEHGFAKLLRGADNFTGILHAMGLPIPHVFAWITIVTEIVGGFCILLGALVPIVSIPMAIVLLVAIFTVHLPYGFSSIKLQAITPNGAQFGQPGYETDLLYLACLVALVLGGSGPFAADNWLLRWLAPGVASRSRRIAD
ncbi:MULTISPECIES: DoxX family protein [Bradyrhizobium]|uniref:DoxX family protein n=1 Tax=Bradyrhizobium elkanii TaxID=29448 RepID=UPI0009B7AB99|nr:DoxX family protein [Bradyrhizobium elkanii]